MLSLRAEKITDIVTASANMASFSAHRKFQLRNRIVVQSSSVRSYRNLNCTIHTLEHLKKIEHRFFHANKNAAPLSTTWPVWRAILLCSRFSYCTWTKAFLYAASSIYHPCGTIFRHMEIEGFRSFIYIFSHFSIFRSSIATAQIWTSRW